MKKIKQTLLALGLAAGTTLFLAGCSEGDHAGHDHGHDHDGHSHAEGEAHQAADGASAVAGKVGETAAAMAVIEKPSAEQLAAAKPYTLDTCVVSGEKLGGMGEPVVLLVGDQQVKMCCDHCLPDLKKDPAKFVAKLTVAE